MLPEQQRSAAADSPDSDKPTHLRRRLFEIAKCKVTDDIARTTDSRILTDIETALVRTWPPSLISILTPADRENITLTHPSACPA